MSDLDTFGKKLTGFIKIRKRNPVTGEQTLLVDKPNMILTAGARLLTHCLAGEPGSKIAGMYIGYNNDNSFDPPVIDEAYTNSFATLPMPFGFLREKLTLDPTYQSSAGYSDNIVLFTTMIASGLAAGGPAFGSGSNIYEVGLVSMPEPGNSARDTVFSRTNFTPIQYDPTCNFSITWGIRILL